jgi:ElaB/YqjD/DUF883 family membrane-anchored ribosome-binding protein
MQSNTPSQRGKRVKKDTPEKLAAPGEATAINVKSLLAKAQRIIQERPVCQRILERFNTLVKDGGCPIHEILGFHYNDEILRNEFAGWIDENFPPKANVKYLKSGDWSPGPKFIRPWHAAYDVNAGNHGLLTSDQSETLLTLVLGNGFQTDPDRFLCIEKISICPPNPVLYSETYEYSKVDPLLAGCFEVNQEKGWHRMQILLFALHVLRGEGLFNEWRSMFTDGEFDDFCTIHATMIQRASDQDRVEANRKATIAAILTRARPNCWNHIHQLEKRVRLGAIAEDIRKEWENPKQLKQVYGIGETEAQAVCNVYNHLESNTIEIYKRAAARHGMHRGPITHSGLACRAIGKGWCGVDYSSHALAIQMTNVASTTELVARRIESDFDQAPSGMRKPIDVAKIPHLARACRGFELALGELESVIPADIFAAESPTLRKKFELGYMDDILVDALDASTTKVELDFIPDFRAIMSRLKETDQLRLLAKSRELRDKLYAATFDDCVHRLDSDVALLIEYFKELLQTSSSWADVDAAERRRRYQKGVVAVQGKMSTHYCVLFSKEDCVINELNDWSQLANGVTTGPGGSNYMLVYCNFSKPYLKDELELRVRLIGNALSQSELNACFIVLPSAYSGLKTTTLLANRRYIEDRFLAHGCDIRFEVSVHFNPSEHHRSDARAKTLKGILAVGSRCASTSPWIGNGMPDQINDVPLVKVKDMQYYVSAGYSDPAHALNAGERASQKGPAAMKTILQTLVGGLGLAPADKVKVFDATMEYNMELAQAVMQLDREFSADASKNMFLFGGLANYKADQALFVSTISGKLIEEWWPQQADFSIRHLTVDRPIIPKPSLEVFSWRDNSPTLPECLEAKFDADSPYYERWCQSLTASRCKVQSMNPQMMAMGAERITPDFTDSPLPLTLEVDLHEVEFNPDDAHLSYDHMVANSCCRCFSDCKFEQS